MASPLQPSRDSRAEKPSAEALPDRSPGHRAWEPPRLRHHGDLRGLTLGPSPGVGESGNPAIFRV